LTSEGPEDFPESLAGLKDEMALDDALTKWLPKAYLVSPSYKPSQQTAETKRRISELSNLLLVRHGDPWLRDFLEFKDDLRFSSAAALLAQTIKENQSGHPDEALTRARQSLLVFHKMQNSAGERRAEFEEIYALERLARSQECLEHINHAERMALPDRFPWLRAQLVLEKSTCIGRQGNLDRAIQEAERAVAIAQRAKFEVLALRALGMLTELKATIASDDDSWQLAQIGLEQFWRGGFPALRGYQFYGSLGYTAENAKQWQLATALNLEAVRLIAQTNNKSVEAMARYRLAGDALMAGNTALAATEFQRANALFAALPQTDAWKAYTAYSQVVLAGLEAHRNKIGRSRDLLENSAPDLANIDDFIIQLSYYQTHGELQWKNGQIADATRSFQSALQICRMWLNHLRNNNDRMAWRTLVGNVYRDLADIYTSNEYQPEKALSLWQEFHRLSESRPIGSSSQERRTTPVDFSSHLAPPPANALTEKLRTLHDRSLLTFVQFQDGVGIWFGDDRGLSFHKVQLKALALERKIRRFRTLCSRHESDQNAIRAGGKELYDILIAPIARNLDTRRVLLIDADESLKNLPFQALVDEQGHYFGQTAAIISSPGLDFEIELGHQDESRLFQQDASILAPTAPPDLENDLLPLEDAVQEARSVATHFPKNTLLLDRDATRDAMQAALMHSSTVHFAGHAIFKNDQVGLVLAAPKQKGSSVAKSELFSSESLKKGTAPRLRLVVLAACSTAASSEDDLYLRGNLVQAFLQARVAHVVAAQWDVDSEATKALMEKFYSELSSGKSVAQSIQSAQNFVLSQRVTSHPYYWAAFKTAGGS
jgi:CHAT domain-containing protein